MSEEPAVVDRQDPRTHYEARMDVLYNTFLWGLHQRLYTRASAGLAMLSLLFASSAVAYAIQQNAIATSIQGIVLAVLAVINHVWSPRVKAMEAEQARKRYVDLYGEAPSLTMEEIDVRLAGLDKLDSPPIEALRKVAYNKGVESQSRPGCRLPLNDFERFMQAIA